MAIIDYPISPKVAQALNEGRLKQAVTWHWEETTGSPFETMALSNTVVIAVINGAATGNKANVNFKFHWLVDYLKQPEQTARGVGPGGEVVIIDGDGNGNGNGGDGNGNGNGGDSMPLFPLLFTILGAAATMRFVGPILNVARVMGVPGAAGIAIKFSRLPGPLQTIIKAAGFEQVVDWTIPLDLPSVGDIPGWFFNAFSDQEGVTAEAGDYVAETGIATIGTGSSIMLPQTSVVGSWKAGTVTFYRLANGSIAVQRLNGTWRVFRYRKPIVLYSDGAGNLRTFLRADAALDRQAKQLDKALRRRNGGRRSPRRVPKTIVLESGKGGVQSIDL